MSNERLELRGFKAIFTTVGAIYVVLAGSMLVRGVVVLRDFGVPEGVVSSPAMEDFFLFFYQLMAAFGVMMVTFGKVTRELSSQLLVSRVFFVLMALATLRDLSTSDSRFGTRLYRGDATLVFVYIDLAFAAAFAWLSLGRQRRVVAPPSRAGG
jgi:Na+/glutamate symporter